MSKQKPNGKSGSSTKRGILLVSILFVILTAVFALFFYLQIEEVTKNRITRLINDKLAPEAKIEISEFDISYYPLGASLRGVRLVHLIPFGEKDPKKNADAIRKLIVDEIRISDINILRFIFGNRWRVDQLDISGLYLELTPLPDKDQERSEILPPVPDIRINRIILSESNVYWFRERPDENAAASVNEIYLEIDSFFVPAKESPNHHFFDDIVLETSALRYSTGNGNYDLTAETFALNSRKKILKITGGKSNPLKTAAEMALESGRPKDTFYGSFEEFFAEGVEIENLIAGKDFYSTKISFANPELSIRRDRSLPRPERENRTLPHVQFHNLPLTVTVDSLFVTDGYLSYGEEYMDEDREGVISFYGIEMAIANLDNRGTDDSISIHIDARFMNLAPLTMNILFESGEKGTHHVKGRLGELDLTAMNSTIEGFLPVRVRRGHTRSIDFDFIADDDISRGMLIFVYDDLEVRFFDSDTQRERRRDRFRSFIANQFIVRSDNPPENPRNAVIEYNRDKERSIFNYWWRSISNGLLDTIQR